jgi:enoyl-CoA hydratase
MMDKVLSRRDGNLAVISFNNPERHNAISLDMWRALRLLLSEFANDKSVKVLVLTGNGGRSFASGADISEFEKGRSNEENMRVYNEIAESAIVNLLEFPKPTLAMIQGYCIGGGLGLALCTDIRISADNAEFSGPAAKLGLGYSYGSVKRLVDLVGASYAKEMYFTARQFDAAEALRMGLVNRVVPSTELDSLTAAYVQLISKNDPMSIHAFKVGINEAVKDDRQRDIQLVDSLIAQCFKTSDCVKARG